jgi:deoxycytidine triphosphate deaminase
MFEEYNPHEWKTIDPDWGVPERKGMLLSDQIHRFCTQKPGLLIGEGYNERNLRPAAYTLTIGDVYYDHEGTRKELNDKNLSFEMPPNSIVFVSIAESLDLPFYIAARFNLRVEWVYKGILLGTGPQVEPGFRGQLSCPLYNLTDQRHRITRGDEFATIDFERTTNFVKESPRSILDNLKQEGKLFSYESGGKKFLLFTQRQFKALEKYPPFRVVSSLVQMQRELAMWRRIGIAIVVSFFALTLTLLNFHNNLLRDTVTNIKDVVETKDQLVDSQKDIAQLKEQLAGSQKAVAQLEGQVRDTQKEVDDLRRHLPQNRPK